MTLHAWSAGTNGIVNQNGLRQVLNQKNARSAKTGSGITVYLTVHFAVYSQHAIVLGQTIYAVRFNANLKPSWFAQKSVSKLIAI